MGEGSVSSGGPMIDGDLVLDPKRPVDWPLLAGPDWPFPIKAKNVFSISKFMKSLNVEVMPVHCIAANVIKADKKEIDVQSGKNVKVPR